MRPCCDWVLALFDGDAARRKLLVDNPAELYGFDA